MEQGTQLTLPVVISSGLVDSLNPCAFALLLVFVATMLGMLQRKPDREGEQQARFWLLSRGGIYILGIFLTYLALGFGLLGAMQFTKSLTGSHVVGRIAALFAVGLGLLALQEALLPEWGSRLNAHVSMPKVRGLVKIASFPALFLAGILIGFCTVPCAGSVYLAVLALLSTQATLLQGVGYLLLYNIVFILPLVVILLLAASPQVYRRLARWQLHRRAFLKFGTSVMALSVGLLTLVLI
ncbi:MAG TPA: cytochrome c biogenesis protein CcdA [Chloroflexia bacterium]|nr:cytochrome c biogenesis protein CcdA [Chloroflexia bacterium]